jgi:hypothetical protein
VVLLLEAGHAVAPVWRLDTMLDLFEVAHVGAKIGQLVRASEFSEALE